MHCIIIEILLYAINKIIIYFTYAITDKINLLYLIQIVDITLKKKDHLSLVCTIEKDIKKKKKRDLVGYNVSCDFSRVLSLLHEGSKAAA